MTNLTVVADEEMARLVIEAALVAVTTHVPMLVTVSELPDTAQPAAVPFVTMKVTAPVPEPPLVKRVSAIPRVPERDVMLRTACVPWLSVALLVAVVRFLEVSVAVRVHEPVELISSALKVATPATAVAIAVPPRVHEDVIVTLSVPPVPVGITLP
jgi:hypothetical protein